LTLLLISSENGSVHEADFAGHEQVRQLSWSACG